MRQSLGVLLLVLVAIAILFGGLAFVRQAAGIAIYAEVPRADGVREGQQVGFRGVIVGHIDSVGFTDNAVRLKLMITRKGVPLRAGDKVKVRAIGVFGDQAIDIVPGPGSAPLIGAGAELGSLPPDTTPSLLDMFKARVNADTDSQAARTAKQP